MRFLASYQLYSELRDYNHMTDHYVSSKAKVSTATISQWKNGNTYPTRNTIDKLAAFFKVPANYFYKD